MKTVLVTGGNRGLGLGFVRHYLANGWQVIACVRSAESATVFEQLGSEHGDRIDSQLLDVGDQPSINDLTTRLSDGGCRLDLAINNAGICDQQSFGDWTFDSMLKNLRINALGPAMLVQSLKPLLNDGAKIINLSSGMGSVELNINPTDAMDAYAMSKAALNRWTVRLAEQFKPLGYTAVVINPGWVRTDMGGEEAPGNVEDAVANIFRTIEGLTLEDAGKFLSDEGAAIPW